MATYQPKNTRTAKGKRMGSSKKRSSATKPNVPLQGGSTSAYVSPPCTMSMAAQTQRTAPQSVLLTDPTKASGSGVGGSRRS